MSIIAVNELKRGQEGRRTARTQTRTRVFQVHSDTVAETVEAVLSATGVPQPGDLYPGLVGVFCRETSARLSEEASRLLWEVRADYEVPGGGSAPGATPDPCDEFPEISFGDEQVSIPLEKAYKLTAPADVQNSPTLAVDNSAGDPFDPPFEIPTHITVVTIRRNERKYNPEYMEGFKETVNDRLTRIAGILVAAYAARMNSVSAEPMRDAEDKLYYKVTYVIGMNPRSWVVKLLDIGFNRLVGGKKERIRLNGSKEQAPNPVKLDGAGGQLAEGGTPVYRTFTPYFPRNWSPLGLPVTLREED